jgi:DNA invertase Pin-like site-specific DNA recombinase
MQRYISYARFSPRPNAKDCDSVEVQNADLLEAVAGRADGHLILADMFDDKDASGRSSLFNRPGLEKAIAALKPGDILIVRSWDRLARSLFVQLEVARLIDKKRAKLLSLTESWWDTGDDNLWLSNMIRAVMAEYQRRQISKTTKSKMLKHQSNGLYMGGRAVFGYKVKGEPGTDKDGKAKIVNKKLIPIPSEQETIAKIIELHDERCFTWPEIARTLAAEGRMISGKKKWHPNVVRRIYQRESTKGKAA